MNYIKKVTLKNICLRYDGVTQSVKIGLIWISYLINLINCDKRSVLLSFTNEWVNKIYNGKISHVFRKSFFNE